MQLATHLVKIAVVLGFINIISCSTEPDTVPTEQDPAEIMIGERLFLETRFAQAYFAYLDSGIPQGSIVHICPKFQVRKTG